MCIPALREGMPCQMQNFNNFNGCLIGRHHPGAVDCFETGYFYSGDGRQTEESAFPRSKRR